MQTTPFVWLGSGRVKKHNVGCKGRGLDDAAKAGLPVPQGGILLDDFYRIVMQEGVAVVAQQQVTMPDPIWFSEVLYRDVRFPRLQKKVAVRHAFATASEDQDNPEELPLSWHGRCPTQLNIDFNDANQLAKAVGTAWSAVIQEGSALRRDLLIMEMVAGERAGTAVSHVDLNRDLVWIDENDLTRPPTLEIPRRRAFRRGDTQLSLSARRLQRLLDGVRRTFGKGNWQIDWVDDGKICWLIRICRQNKPFKNEEIT